MSGQHLTYYDISVPPYKYRSKMNDFKYVQGLQILVSEQVREECTCTCLVQVWACAYMGRDAFIRNFQDGIQEYFLKASADSQKPTVAITGRNHGLFTWGIVFSFQDNFQLGPHYVNTFTHTCTNRVELSPG